MLKWCSNSPGWHLAFALGKEISADSLLIFFLPCLKSSCHLKIKMGGGGAWVA